jgi:5-methyltetrahydrofolate--homocysteine methyltransferase
MTQDPDATPRPDCPSGGHSALWQPEAPGHPPGMGDLEDLGSAIEAGDRKGAVAAMAAAIAGDTDPQAIVDAMSAAMAEVGRRFQTGEIYVPEMLVSARAMKEASALLEPVLVAGGIRPERTAVIGTVRGDLHDIGKNLVTMMWKGANIEVVDLGTNVTPEQFVAGAREHRAHLVGVSALLTTTMHGMRDVVAAVHGSGLEGVRVMVGGAPVTQAFADEIGADGYAPDAAAAVAVATRLLGLDVASA